MAERKHGEGCQGCIYRKALWAAHHKACHYCIETGKLRGCPAGKDCIRYERAPKKRKRAQSIDYLYGKE